MSQITNGEIHGSITSSPSSTLAQTTVTFSDDPEIYATHETVERVSKAIRKAQELDRELRGRELRIGRGKEFVQKVSACEVLLNGWSHLPFFVDLVNMVWM